MVMTEIESMPGAQYEIKPNGDVHLYIEVDDISCVEFDIPVAARAEFAAAIAPTEETERQIIEHRLREGAINAMDKWRNLPISEWPADVRAFFERLLS